ncbi:M28 family peptidase [Cytophagaceae bacterium ABcell3]|nr:M28 family peptidase [Cytophagaceae bacterium ABcell3]
MKNNNISYAVSCVAAFLLLLSSCGEQQDRATTESPQVSTTKEVKEVNVPSFNADSAYYFIEKQVSFGPRVPNTEPHRKTGKYLVGQLEKMGLKTYVQEFEAEAFDGTVLQLKNIVGSINPEASKRILLAAHWDTRPFADQDSEDTDVPIDGANDGASGVGVLLELARVIQSHENKPDVGIDIIFFDGEDYGQPEGSGDFKPDTWCLGSQYWARNKHKENYSAYYGILLDMVGGANAKFALEGTSMKYAPSVMKKVWDTGNRLGYSNHFIYKQTAPITDDHYYVNTIAKIPMIDIIEYNPHGDGYFGDYWHTHDDNMDVIDRATLQAVGHTLLEVLYRE